MQKLFVFLIFSLSFSCFGKFSFSQSKENPFNHNHPKNSLGQLLSATEKQTQYTFYYDPQYVKLPYPGGDVPLERGVCSDVVIRAFRGIGRDLQKDLHEDMKSSFSAYPKMWGLKKPDPNIDHRRVANLMTYFERKGYSLPVSQNPSNYLPGDVVAWRLDNGLLHIGLVSDLPSYEANTYQIIHNIGSGAKAEARLFAWKIIGHYRIIK
jgi:hypothetical protein